MISGRTVPPESSTFRDEETGATIRQVTSHPSDHHHPFYYVPCMDDAMQRLFFVSHRTGRPEIWCEVRAGGELQQLTEQEELNEWSIHPSHDGRFVYYTAGGAACRVSTGDGSVDRLLEAGGAALGTIVVSHDDRYCAVPVKTGARSQFVVIDTEAGTHDTILEADKIGHPEFHPSDNTLLRYAGPHDARIWVIHRDGTGNRLVYDRKPYGDGKHFEWIVHETWNPGPARRSPEGEGGSREIITASWPNGCVGIDIDSGTARPVCTFNAWHPGINRQGTLMCADTTFPDIGLQLFDPTEGVGTPRTLCLSGSSNVGAHWDTPYCPYDDEDYRQGKWRPYAPQQTHPHPCFSPDGTKVVFTSDRTGHAQVYEVDVPVMTD